MFCVYACIEDATFAIIILLINAAGHPLTIYKHDTSRTTYDSKRDGMSNALRIFLFGMASPWQGFRILFLFAFAGFPGHKTSR
jgi:hypothetical protein